MVYAGYVRNDAGPDCFVSKRRAIPLLRAVKQSGIVIFGPVLAVKIKTQQDSAELCYGNGQPNAVHPDDKGSTSRLVIIRPKVRTKEMMADIRPSDRAVNRAEAKDGEAGKSCMQIS